MRLAKTQLVAAALFYSILISCLLAGCFVGWLVGLVWFGLFWLVGWLARCLVGHMLPGACIDCHQSVCWLVIDRLVC